jgi:trimeric autotransporter adhesin
MRASWKAAVLTMAVLGIAGFASRGATAAGFAQQAASVETVRVTPGEGGAESVPRLVQFNGTLKDAAERPVTGVASVTFAIYAEQERGAALWSETQNVIADANGHYNVLLGGATASGMPAELFGTGQSRWLGVTIARQSEMPRVLLASVPYALKAADADTLGGLPASAYVTTQSLAASNARPATPVNGGNTTILTTQSAVQTNAGDASPSSVTQATPTGSGTTNFVPLWTSSSALGNSILFQNASRIGVGTTSPVVTLDVNGDSIFRGSFQLAPQATATATTGQPSHSYQWEASTFNNRLQQAITTAYGFRATPQGNNTTNATSTLDLYYGPGGGTLTDTGLSINNTGIITFVAGQTFPGATATVNELNLPNSTSLTNGVITMGGNPVFADYGNYSNLFVGSGAGSANQETSSAELNTASGWISMEALTSGSDNSAYGAQSLIDVTSGSYNTGVGEAALGSTTTGLANTAVGELAGGQNTTGSDNTFIGVTADAGAPNLTNATAIGVGAVVGSSNALVLGNTGNYPVNVGIGTGTPESTLELSSSKSSVGTGIPPAPTVTLTNTAGGAGANVSLDFNTSAPRYGSGYNPGSRILVFDEGDFTDSIVFQANTKGDPNQGLKNTMAIHSNGGVEIFGNLQVDGSMSKGGGSFKIDDPIAPAEKYLSHSFVESPDMMNIYNGNVVTDAKGFATVEMAAWFEALNGEFRYQLTTVNSFARATVAQEIQGGKFRIRTSRPNVKVSWQVTGVRHDAWANAHRIPTEETKPQSEQGHYLYPELFGAGPDKSIANASAPAPTAHADATRATPQQDATGKR